MNGLLFNIMLALAWAALVGEISANSLGFGFVLGFLVLFISQRIAGKPMYARKMAQIIELFAFFLVELVVSNARVTLDVLKPRLSMRPGVIAVPLDAQTDIEVLLLVNLVMLTPGTLALDVSSDRSELYLHTMHAEDPERVRAQIKQGFERRVLGILR